MAEQGKSKKAGRAKNRCAAYRAAGRREVNKVKRALRCQARGKHPKNAPQLAAVLQTLKPYIVQAQREMDRAREAAASGAPGKHIRIARMICADISKLAA